ncbi:MAG: class I SAM-dependent methyltransferase [Acidobacteria bacterium]|nr:class I SAM-dependent methyltransferase [Acidobacteriota bacterium]MBI3656672.1 class I SAM-dependent methyltransferase [Acidobacteriota bacterium]
MDRNDLPFTGERYVPECMDEGMRYEHWHRYRLAEQFSRGRRVLDLASGEGYGSFLLSENANFAVGMDCDRQSLEHAAAKYRRGLLAFTQGRAESLPFREATFDLVTAFEVIEHLEPQEAMLAEIARVLRPYGVGMISTPNKKVYSDDRDYANPYHVREFYVPQFRTLLQRYFKHVRLLGQRLAAGSLIWPLSSEAQPGAATPVGLLHAKTPARESQSIKEEAAYADAMYVVAICSQTPISTSANFYVSGLMETEGRYLEEKEGRIRGLQREVASMAQWGRQLDDEIRQKEELIRKWQGEVAALSAACQEKDALIVRQQRQFEERTQWALQLDAACRDKDAALAAIRRSLAYRALRKLGALP